MRVRWMVAEIIRKDFIKKLALKGGWMWISGRWIRGK